jgi:ribosomal protein S27AE
MFEGRGAAGPPETNGRFEAIMATSKVECLSCKSTIDLDDYVPNAEWECPRCGLSFMAVDAGNGTLRCVPAAETSPPPKSDYASKQRTYRKRSIALTLVIPITICGALALLGPNLLVQVAAGAVGLVLLGLANRLWTASLVNRDEMKSGR